MRQMALQDILDSPVRFIWRSVQKAIILLLPGNSPLGLGVVEESPDRGLIVNDFRAYSGVRLVFIIVPTLVVSLGILGTILCFFGTPADRSWAATSGCLILGTIAIYSITYPEDRYRYPINPIFCISAAVLLSNAIRFFALSRSR